MTIPGAGATSRTPVGLFGKMLGLVVAMFALIAVTTVGFSAWNLNRRLIEEYSSKGVGIAESISSSSSELLLNRDASTLQAVVDQFRAIAGVGYVYVVDSDGDIVSHTFVPAVPKEIMAETQKRIERGARLRVHDLTLAGTGSFVDIGSPVLGGLAGSVHVGMDKAVIGGYIRAAILQLMLLIACTLLVSIALAWLYVRRISRPLTDLTAYARRLAVQDFSAAPAIESRDEVGVLARTMGQMAGEMARAQEILEERVQERTRQLTESNTKLEAEVAERRRIEVELQSGFRSQGLLNEILRISLDNEPLEQQLQRALEVMLSAPWMPTRPMGSISLMEDGVLKMKADKGLAAAIVERCAAIPLGYCLCGRAAATGETQYAACIDERHDVTFEGMAPHGHYNVPILLEDEVLGVVNFYLAEGHPRSESEVAFLEAVASTLAGLIKRKQTENELKNAKEAAEEANRGKSNFLSSVSHELRTPLTSILGFAKLIDKDFRRLFLPLVGGDEKLVRRGERVGDNLNVIVREGERLTRLINDVLDLAKIESGRLEWRDSIVDVKDLVEHSVQAVTGQFAGLPDVALTVDVAPGLPSITVDRDRLTQVLINLLNNAAKFTKAGCVEVTARVNARGEVQVGVRDTGPGIPPEFLEKVFEKFQQVASDTLSEKPQGTGLGLPICRQIVQHYGGRIWAESELGHGSTFVFTLPAGPQAPCAPAETAPAPLLRTKPLILVVDDDPGVCRLLAQILEDDGYQVITARDGQAGLDLARLHGPDLITMDLMMPGMDGYTAIEQLRQDERLRKIPIVVITALGDHAAVESAAALPKPVDEALLLQTIRSVLKDGGGRQPCLVLEAPGHTLQLPVFRVASIENVAAEALWQRLEAGFRGTVVVGHGLLKGEQLDRLTGYASVQVVIVPANEGMPAAQGGAATPPGGNEQRQHEGEAAP